MFFLLTRQNVPLKGVLAAILLPVIVRHLAHKQDQDEHTGTPHVYFGIIHLLVYYLGRLVVHWVLVVHFYGIQVMRNPEVYELDVVIYVVVPVVQLLLLGYEDIFQSKISVYHVLLV